MTCRWAATATLTVVLAACGDSEPLPEVVSTDATITYVGPGEHVVGDSVDPGTYRAFFPDPFCYWERVTNFSGDRSAIIANNLEDGSRPVTVTIRPDDYGFNSQGCGLWQRVS